MKARPHVSLNQAAQDLEGAIDACKRAEQDLQAARNRWATERQKGSSDFTAIELDLQRARIAFSNQPYIHIELDNNSPESLTERIKVDQRAREEREKTVRAIEATLQNTLDHALDMLFTNLAKFEETLYQSTVWLAEQTNSLQIPRSNAERYPQQYRILRQIVQQIKLLQQQERETTTLTQLRAFRTERKTLETLLAKLDPSNRFELQEVLHDRT
ncbi:hypothetical protein HC928_16385 [bacterium]|nr:hypothetical protein [bacterium]